MGKLLRGHDIIHLLEDSVPVVYAETLRLVRETTSRWKHLLDIYIGPVPAEAWLALIDRQPGDSLWKLPAMAFCVTSTCFQYAVLDTDIESLNS